MSNELERVKQLVDLNPVPKALTQYMDTAWAVHCGKIPDNYLICPELFWAGICHFLGYVPAHIRCSARWRVYIAFSFSEIKKEGR